MESSLKINLSLGTKTTRENISHGIDQNQGQVEDTGEKFRTISSKNAWKPDEGVHIPITH